MSRLELLSQHLGPIPGSGQQIRQERYGDIAVRVVLDCGQGRSDAESSRSVIPVRSVPHAQAKRAHV